MATQETVSKILNIEIDFKEAVKKVAEYNSMIAECKKQETALTKVFKKGGISEIEYRKSMEAAKMERQRCATSIREIEKEMQNEIRVQQENEGSLRSLRAQLSNTTKQYDELSRAERDGTKGKELQEKINAITAELKGAEEETGRFYRNVGNYEGALRGVFGNNALIQGIGNVKSGIIGVKGSMDLAAKTPLLFIISSLITIFQKMSNAAKGNEEQMAKLNKITQPLSVAFDFLVNILEAAVDVFLSVASAVTDAITTFTDWIGITDDLNGKTKEYMALEQTKQDLIKRTRKSAVEAAQTEQEVSELRAKIAQKDKYTAAERRAMLEDVITKEKAIAEEKAKIAQENLRILEQEGERTKNSAEFEDKLSQARIAVIKATTDYNNKTRELNGQLAELNNTETAAIKAAREKAKQESQKKLEMIKAAKEVEKALLQSYEYAMIGLIDDNYEKQRQSISVQYDREIDALKLKLETDKTLTEASRQAISNIIIAKEEQKNQELRVLSNEQAAKDISEAQEKYEKLLQLDKDAARLEFESKIEAASGNELEILNIKLENKRQELDSLHQMEEESMDAFLLRKLEKEREFNDAKQEVADKEVEIEHAKYEAISTITGGLSTLMEAAGEKNKAFAKAAKVLALGEIAINTGKAISLGVAQSQNQPYPLNLVAVASTIATVMANIATATKTVKSAKFSTGGLVTGSGTSTSDSIPALLSDRESVNTARSTAMFGPLLSSLNVAGGGVPIRSAETSAQALGEDMLARSVAKGIQAMPRPVVSVTEINEVGNRVKVLENLGTI